MKKVLSIAAVALFALCMTSCAKDYTCDCVDKDSSGIEMGSSSSAFKAKKKDAKAVCDALESNPNIWGGQTTCTLK